MTKIKQSAKFRDWLTSLKNPAKGWVIARIDRIKEGNFGDCKSVGGGVMETRIHHGPGYRLYFTKREGTIVYLLAGGTKSSQSSDIELAKEIAKEI